VEENCSWTTRFPSGILAACNTTYGAELSGFFKVHGSKGSIEMAPAFDYDGLHLQAMYFGNRFNHLDIPSTNRQPYQFTAEANHFSNCVQNNLEPKTPGEEGLRDVRYIAEIYQAASAAR
jgi:predicted dehydrogenase